ncbi:acyl-CoA dehydrogenase family protein [Sphingobium indicum]|uniref:acyl-CoA dehydrogenase family protein n=1 Tax=Sphingobium indicum TaxID=332055 RepID=UPI0018CBB7D6|nr:acyl-CoA dehydrogenase family protein [Sphingobium indicum]
MTQPLPVVEPAPANTREIVACASAQLERLTATLAMRCARNGALDSTALDTHQILSYELAFAASELLAARILLTAPGTSDGSLHNVLAGVFAADAVPSALARLAMIAREIGYDLGAIQAVGAGPAYDALLAGGSTAALEDAGVRLEEGREPFAEVVVSHEVEMARDAFRRFAADVVAPLAEKIHRHDLTVPEALLGPMREMGVFGLSVPARYGGTAPDEGEDNQAVIAITEALSEASLAAAGSLITRPEILTRAMLAGGTEEQKATWLPKIAVGDPLCAIAITEPDCGSDVASLSLKGTKVEGGWRLNGAKTWCTFAGKAGLMMVVARTGTEKGHKGLSILLVQKPSYDGHEFEYRQEEGGLLCGKAIPTIGYRGMHSFDIVFENFFVPDANVLGEEGGLGRGFYFTMQGMTGGRMQTAARACGVMRAALNAAFSYAADRKVFGRPLGDYQLTRAKLARMSARFAASRQLAYHVGAMLNEGHGQMEASLVKLFACRSAEVVTREALQIHGGMGYAEEVAVSRYFVDARVLSIFEGAEETLALKVVARGLMERALKTLNH